MPKIDVFPLFADNSLLKPFPAPLPPDAPCPFGELIVLKNNARVYVKSKDTYVWIRMPYSSGIIEFTVPKELYSCIGWMRMGEDYEVTIWDRHYSCTFTIPALDNLT